MNIWNCNCSAVTYFRFQYVTALFSTGDCNSFQFSAVTDSHSHSHSHSNSNVTPIRLVQKPTAGFRTFPAAKSHCSSKLFLSAFGFDNYSLCNKATFACAASAAKHICIRDISVFTHTETIRRWAWSIHRRRNEERNKGVTVRPNRIERHSSVWSNRSSLEQSY